MVKVFITGATGFIGQQLVAQLKRQGEVIKVLSRAQNFEYETVICEFNSCSCAIFN